MEGLMSRTMGRQAAGKVAELWKLHGIQNYVFKIAMREELPVELRSICGKGYLITSLCMNEISTIYNQLKCPLQDDPLQFSDTEKIQWANVNPGTQMIDFLQQKQKKLLKKYVKLLAYFDKTEPSLKVLEEHIFVLRRLADKLVANWGSGSSDPKPIVECPNEAEGGGKAKKNSTPLNLENHETTSEHSSTGSSDYVAVLRKY